MIILQRLNVNTKHVLAAGSIVIAAWLLWSSITQPDGFVMSFAAGGVYHGVLRTIIIAALIAVLFSRPPRSMQFRVALGVASSLIIGGACLSMIDYQIGVLDAILYLQVAIILAIEAIENQKAPVRLSPQQSINS